MDYDEGQKGVDMKTEDVNGRMEPDETLNPVTQAAMAEAERLLSDPESPRVHSAKELFAALDA